MATEYKLTNGTAIIRTSDGARISADPANVDYQEYLAWVVAGNTADAAQTDAEILAAKISVLDAEYQSQFADLAQAYATALMAGDTTTAASVQTDYTTLKSEYKTKLEAIG